MPLRLPTNSDSLSLKGLNQSSDFLSASSVLFCPTTRTAARNQMPLLAAAPLISLFFFSGFATAEVVAPPCTLPTWQWECILSFSHHLSWPLPDPMAYLCCPVSQFSQPKCVYGRSVHDVNMQRGL